ncbi:DegT/DnrJ/EryC1/StrS family aminotransferase [Hwanghaeella sp.]|uniref:DegT/DnrJ/EryC1/StrS family aminotransferase n=1 Tax=Hwanghaeella sp. TaxID=2605943 RepID=UPI003CCBD57F
MTAATIPFGKPMLAEDAFDAVRSVLESGILVHGKITEAFEQAFADRIGVKHAVAVSSCTAGLHLVHFCRGIGPGDRVAVPAMTHVATAHAVELAGAKPLFIDVEASTGNMDATLLAKAVEDGAKLAAVMPVHYLGLPCDMDAINEAATAAGAYVLEDCALAVDATYKGRKAGGLGLAGAFSFYPVKHMTSIEGGMVTTDDGDLAAAIRKRRAFSYNRALGERTRPGIYDVDALGYNYRMSEVEAAVGLSQLSHLDGFQETRARNDAILRDGLAELSELTIFPDSHGQARSSHYCFNIVLPRDGSLPRDRVVDFLKAKGVGTSVHYPSAVPMFEYYRTKYGYRPGQFPVAEWLGEQTVSLPVAPHVSESDARYIVDCVRDAIQTVKRG